MAAPKTETPPAAGTAAAAAGAAGAGGAGGAAPPAPVKKGGIGAWIPLIAAVVLAPVVTWATVELVLLPRLRSQMTAAAPGEPSAEAAPAAPAAPAQGTKSGKEAKGAKESSGGPGTYEFLNVVVNLAGTLGTRYLKTSFVVTPVKGQDLKPLFEGSRARMMDVTLNVLSSLTLSDLEEPGSKNIIREKLVMAYNQALGKKIADQIYFSDFVIQ